MIQLILIIGALEFVTLVWLAVLYATKPKVTKPNYCAVADEYLSMKF